MMTALEETAQQARDNAIHFSIDERLSDALASINLSIELFPIEAEFHLQRLIQPISSSSIHLSLSFFQKYYLS